MTSSAIKGLPTLPPAGSKAKGERVWLPIFQAFIDQLRIQSKEVASEDDRGTKMDLWGSQRIFLERVAQGMDEGVRDFLCLKSRQLGITTISLAIDLFWLGTHPNMMGVIVADNEGNRSFFRQTIVNYHKSLPDEFVRGVFEIVKNNEKYILFSNGSRLDFLVAGTRKKTWGEGRGYTLCHCTEVSKYGTAEGIASFKETLAEKHPDRLFLWESTALGYNHWKDMYEEGERDTFTKRSFFIGWWSKEINSISRRDQRFKMFGVEPPNKEERDLMKLVRDRHGVIISMEQLAWRRARDADTSLGKQDLDQNQPWIAEQAFVQSGHSFFQSRLVARNLDRVYDQTNPITYIPYRFYLGTLLHDCRMDPIDVEEINQKGTDIIELRVWEQPVEGATYVLGCDPAYGRNDWKDRHGLSVWRCFADKMVQVAEYADNRVETYQAAWVLAYLAAVYKDVIINIELTGPGRAVFQELNSKRDEYRTESKMKISMERGWDNFCGSVRHYLYHRPDSIGAGYAYHTEMTYSIKSRVMNSFRDAFTTGELLIRSAPLLEEMQTVIQDGASIAAPGTMKDDRVFAAVLACMAWKDWVRSGMIQNGQTYEDVIRSEVEGPRTKADEMVRHIVHNFWKTQSELANTPQEKPMTYLETRGL